LLVWKRVMQITIYSQYCIRFYAIVFIFFFFFSIGYSVVSMLEEHHKRIQYYY